MTLQRSNGGGGITHGGRDEGGRRLQSDHHKEKSESLSISPIKASRNFP